MGATEDLPSHRDISFWVQFGRTQRDFPVRGQAPGRAQMAKTQSWDGDGAGMGMELMREGMGKSPLSQEEEAETINTFAPIVQNPGVFTGGSRGSCRHRRGVPGLQHALRSWGPVWVPCGDSGHPMDGGWPRGCC